jgi:hypothetical protein
MDAISDSEAIINPNPTNVQIMDQHIPASPPFSKPSVLELNNTHELATSDLGLGVQKGDTHQNKLPCRL